MIGFAHAKGSIGTCKLQRAQESVWSANAILKFYSRILVLRDACDLLAKMNGEGSGRLRGVGQVAGDHRR